MGLLVYGLIQRQVRQYLAQHEASIPGNKGPTGIPTATVIFESFATVMRVELTLEDMRVSQIQGWQAHHERICQALELDFSIYEVPTGVMKITPPSVVCSSGKVVCFYSYWLDSKSRFFGHIPSP